MRAWLFKIATNLCHNHFRRLRRHPDVGLHEVSPRVEQTLHRTNGFGHADPEQLLLSQDMERHVLAVIDGLPVKQKAALIQRKLYGLPYDSIATSLSARRKRPERTSFKRSKKFGGRWRARPEAAATPLVPAIPVP